MPGVSVGGLPRGPRPAMFVAALDARDAGGTGASPPKPAPDSSEAILIVRSFCCWSLGRLLGELMQRIGQPGGDRPVDRRHCARSIGFRRALAGTPAHDISERRPGRPA